jgi:hypothetical protein
LVNSGEIVDTAVAPTCPTTFATIRERVETWIERTGRLTDRGDVGQSHTLNIVASWFRNRKDELNRTFHPNAAKRLYRKALDPHPKTRGRAG